MNPDVPGLRFDQQKLWVLSEAVRVHRDRQLTPTPADRVLWAKLDQLKEVTTK